MSLTLQYWIRGIFLFRYAAFIRFCWSFGSERIADFRSELSNFLIKSSSMFVLPSITSIISLLSSDDRMFKLDSSLYLACLLVKSPYWFFMELIT